MSRKYNPKYDSVLGPMREPSPPPSSSVNQFQHDNSFLSQLDPSRVGDNEIVTENALHNLFGEVVSSTSHLDDQGQSTNNLEEDDQNNHISSIGVENETTPTLASTNDPTSIESVPISTPNIGTLEQEENQINQIIIDPSLTDQNNAENADELFTSDNTNTKPQKRKATSRANMLARGGACEFCKKRKLKCSAELPSCANCLKTNKECIYSQKKQRSRVRVLEDRLQELEKRLDTKSNHSPNQSSTNINRSDSYEQNENTNNGISDDNGIYDTSDFPTLSTFDLGLDKNDLQNEPDLMTLADAAAADTSIESESWEGLSPEIIVSEILKAISGGNNTGGGKSVGEKIVSHLIQLYIIPPSIPAFHLSLSPSTLLSRLTNKTNKPIHPSVLLSLIPNLLPLSPSITLHSPQISNSIKLQCKNSISNAIINSDPRIIDLVAACTIRSYGFYTEAKFLEGWTETSLSISLIYASGLSKLGHIGERFISSSSFDLNGNKKERLEKEKKLRLVLNKGVAVPPPKDKAELGERINLFWQAYMNDRGGSIGWGWPSSFNDEEITTPWPKAEYDSDASLLDNRTIMDFMNSTTPDDASKDCIQAAEAKSMTLMYHAQRLFDTHSNVSSPDRTSKLMRITRGYMSTSIPINQLIQPGLAVSEGSRIQVWITLYATMCVLHAKEEIDAPIGSEKEYFDKCIENTGKVIEIVELTQNNGDFELDGLKIGSAVVFHFLGRLMTKYIERITTTTATSSSNNWEKNGFTENDQLIFDLNEKKEKFQNYLGILGKKSRFASVASQLLENVAFGSDFKLGEYERPDNMP